MKWLGALLIIVAASWAGYAAALKYRERTRQVRQLKVALQTLEAEIVYSLTPLNEAAEKIAAMITFPVSEFFFTFSNKLSEGNASVPEAWNASLNEIKPLMCLEKNELEILKQFGATLGQHDREHQQKQIRLALLHLEKEEAEAKDEQLKYEKMTKSLGLLGGLLIVIMLI